MSLVERAQQQEATFGLYIVPTLDESAPIPESDNEYTRKWTENLSPTDSDSPEVSAEAPAREPVASPFGVLPKESFDQLMPEPSDDSRNDLVEQLEAGRHEIKTSIRWAVEQTLRQLLECGDLLDARMGETISNLLSLPNERQAVITTMGDAHTRQEQTRAFLHEKLFPNREEASAQLTTDQASRDEADKELTDQMDDVREKLRSESPAHKQWALDKAQDTTLHSRLIERSELVQESQEKLDTIEVSIATTVASLKTGDSFQTNRRSEYDELGQKLAAIEGETVPSLAVALRGLKAIAEVLPKIMENKDIDSLRETQT